MWSQRLGIIGVWRGVEDVDATLAATIEDLGYGTIWLGRRCIGGWSGIWPGSWAVANRRTRRGRLHVRLRTR
jgi:hypothetical protein